MDINKIVFRFVGTSFSILVLLLVFIGVFKVGMYGFDFGYRVFTEKPVDPAPGRDVAVQIGEDMSGMEIGDMLEEKGLVESGKLFFVQLKLSTYEKKIRPGAYTLNTSMTAKEMMAAMAAAPEEDTETESAAEPEAETEEPSEEPASE